MALALLARGPFAMLPTPHNPLLAPSRHEYLPIIPFFLPSVASGRSVAPSVSSAGGWSDSEWSFLELVRPRVCALHKCLQKPDWILARFPQQTRASSRMIRFKYALHWKALSTDVETCVDRLGKRS